MSENEVPQTQLSDSKEPQRWPRDYFVDKGITEDQSGDRMIQDQIWQRLMKEPNLDLSEIEIDVKNGQVTLMGTTSTENMRDHIEHLIIYVEGVSGVKNEIRVLKKFVSKESAD